MLDAWNHYLQHDNNGRGVVLIGHSQGSGLLTQLIRNEIDGNNPYNRHLVKRIGTGYYLLNPRLEVRRGDDWINVYHLANLPLMEQTSGGNNKPLQILQQLMAGEGPDRVPG